MERVSMRTIELHPSWLAVNPIVGCNKNCGYCFLKDYNLTLVKPSSPQGRLMKSEDVMYELQRFKYFDAVPYVALGTRTDIFFIQ